MPTTDTFDWPCDRRDAHHPHTTEVKADTMDCPFDCEHEYNRETGQCVETIDCPGVKAHPATMAGGQYKRF